MTIKNKSIKNRSIKNRTIQNRARQDRQGGFTLVEVLVAITIFGLAVSTLFASFNIVISSIDPMNAGLDDYEMASNAMDRIKMDLKSLCLTHDSIYLPPEMEEDDNPDRFRFISENISFDANSYSQLRFASFEHIGFTRDQKTRIGIINYYVDSSEDGTLVLKRSDIEAVSYDETETYNTKNDPVLCERVKLFELAFVDQDGKIHEYWNSDSSDFDFATPYSISIKLVIGDKQTSNSFATTLVLPTYRDKDES